MRGRCEIGGGVARGRVGKGWAGNAKCMFITEEKVKKEISFLRKKE
jgi:hypothetical protein